jgi:hypothetical protein
MVLPDSKFEYLTVRPERVEGLRVSGEGKGEVKRADYE